MGILSFVNNTIKQENCSSWKKFKLSDLFDIQLAKGDIQAKKMEIGKIPLVSAGMSNNGIVMYIKNSDEISKKFPANCITVDMFGKSFYQEQEFYAVSHGRVNILIPRFNINGKIALFITTILNKKFLGKYSFSIMCSQSKLLKETILLPVNDLGNPDWKYIEQYQANIVTKTKETVDNLLSIIKYNNFNIDIKNWKKFKLSDLFDVKCSKYHDPKKYDDGDIPYIARTTFNNGEIKRVKTNEELYPANCITIGAESAKAFFQTKPFITGNKIYRIYAKNILLNKYIALFISTLLNKEGEKYNYSNAFVQEKICNTILYLPADNLGNPDWNYMEQYTKNLYSKMEKFVI